MYFANCKKIAEDVDRRKITLNGFSKGTLEVLVRVCFDRQVGTFTKSAVCLFKNSHPRLQFCMYPLFLEINILFFVDD